MTTYTWLKLYVEILDDPKTGMMPDRLFRRFVEFLLCAREYNHDGLLGPVSNLAWRLRSSEDDMLNALRSLSEIGIVAETPDGWLVVNFAKRQEALTSTERMRTYRERKRNEVYTNSNNLRYEEVTNNETRELLPAVTDSSSASSSVSISSSDSKEGGTGGEKQNIFAVYENNIGMLTPVIKDALKDDLATYGPDWINAAIQEAIKSEARNLKYVEAILSRWKRDDFKAPRSSGGKQPLPTETVGEHNKRIVKEMVYGSE